MYPRIVLISQWPKVRNGEYELIERIKRTGYKIVVVDYLGFDVENDKCINNSTLSDDYDFAISFHYETPKLINIPTYLWVANPLEFLYLRGDYRDRIIHHIRSYDDYLYNGSSYLKAHIARVVGDAWSDSGLEMFPSCSVGEMKPPVPHKLPEGEESARIFYCGINWERGSDRAGRAQSLLDLLQERQAAHFYGPQKLGGFSPWEGFVSYKGEIPFDGISMLRTMQPYGAVLAVSSPAHIKSRTSSSRVFEATAAGVPVISDHNAHVNNLFSDSVSYFSGDLDLRRTESILVALQAIVDNPAEAAARVTTAQALMKSRFCFEPCFERAAEFTAVAARASAGDAGAASIDVFLFHHDQDSIAPDGDTAFGNADYVLNAAATVAKARHARVRLVCCTDEPPDEFLAPRDGVEVVIVAPASLSGENWDKLRLGAKVALLAAKAEADLSAFFTQFDFPHYDYFTKAVDWLAANPGIRGNSIHVAGHFVSDLSAKAPSETSDILRNNMPVSMYRWSQNSFSEHQLATLTFGRDALASMLDSAAYFDAILPVALIAIARAKGIGVDRSRHILVRVKCVAFLRHLETWKRAVAAGFWPQHYSLVTNYNHEINALYDFVHGSSEAMEIADNVSGHMLQKILAVTRQTPAPADAETRLVAATIRRVVAPFRWIKRMVRRIMRL